MTPAHLICLIDQNTAYRTLAEAIFRLILPQYEVVTLDSGGALELYLGLADRLPGLILLDQDLPWQASMRTLERLQQHPDWKTVPVVMVSADNDGAQLQAYRQAGADSFLHKPEGWDAMQLTLEGVCLAYFGQ